jgi:hypothetical protein
MFLESHRFTEIEVSKLILFNGKDGTGQAKNFKVFNTPDLLI